MNIAFSYNLFYYKYRGAGNGRFSYLMHAVLQKNILIRLYDINHGTIKKD